ncbi:MAG: hypothetical protein V5A23_00785 [Halobacteriales archaeon]
MDEKTERLRDIFTSVTDEETVTDEQAEPRGSLQDEQSGDVSSVVAAMADRYDFATDLPAKTYVAVAQAFYDGADDADVAAAAGVEEATARRARLDLHLYVEADVDPAFDADRARDLLAEADPDEVAAELDADPAAVERFAAATAARERSLRASHRFRDRFEELLADGDLTRRLAADVREDGLDEAAEDIETDVSF